jgi:hypothetical protein
MSAANTISAINLANIFIGLLGVVSNLFACIVIARHRPLRKRPSDYFILNQCVLDLVIGLFLILYIGLNFQYVKDGTALYAVCYLFNTRILFTGTFAVSAWNIAALGVERYMEVVRPINHRLYITKNKVFGAIVGVWVFGISFKTTIVFATTRLQNGICQVGVYPNTAMTIFGNVVNCLGEFVLPLCVVACCYVAMAHSIRRVHFSTVASNSGATSRTKRNILKVLAAITIAFTLCVAPKQLVYLFGVGKIDYNGPVFLSCLFLNYANCCINPFIYMFNHDEFKKGLRTVIGCKKTADTSLDINVVTSIAVTKKKTQDRPQKPVIAVIELI